MIIREHDFTGGKGCIHCRAVRTDALCNEREVAEPEPWKPRVKACEDGGIAERMAELRREREAAWNAPEVV
jgi:hypothetical protein